MINFFDTNRINDKSFHFVLFEKLIKVKELSYNFFMKYLGIDLGSKSIGLATGQGIIASAWKTLYFPENDFNSGITKLLFVINDYQPDKIIMGYPKNMNGTIGSSAQQVIEFKNQLDSALENKKEIILIDERLTTFAANNVLIMANMRRNDRKKVKDQLAASIILQTYFDKQNQS